MWGDLTWNDVDPIYDYDTDCELRQKWIDCCMGKITMDEYNSFRLNRN